MIRPILVLSILATFVAAPAIAQPGKEPAVVAKMREMGSVYLTWQRVPKTTPPTQKPVPTGETAPNVIVGVDFRPMAGTDSKKIAAVVQELKALPDLQSLLLLGMDVNDSALDAIPTSAKLVRIQLFRTKVTDKGVASLQRLTRLSTFSYTGNELTDEGMKSLAKMTTLTSISVVDAKITDAGILALHKLPGLVSFVAENTQVTERGMDLLRERLPKLKQGIRELR